jgi:anaerobic selenocysteine-containing dehydrogenase
MHILFRDGLANRGYMAQYTDCPAELEAHLQDKTPEWAAAITGLPVATIEEFAALVGNTPKTYLRLGYGFSRQRNGVVNMHAASCIAAVTGSWLHEGGGAFHNNGAIYHWDRGLIEGLDVRDRAIRVLDQSRIGPVLTGDREALFNGPPVTAMLIQNTNPMMVAPDLNLVHRGFAREDLFTCVHEQFMTETAQMADIVLPATMFLEHDDFYQGGGHQFVAFGGKVVEPPDGPRCNHEVIAGLAKRLGAEHRGFAMNERQIIDETLKASGWGSLEALEKGRWIDCQPDFEDAHYLNGFGHPDGRFRFAPHWDAVRPHGFGPVGAPGNMPTLPDHFEVIEEATADKPFRLATSPARNYLNSTFTESPTSIAREGRPEVMIHPEDAAKLGVAEGDRVRIGNERGNVVIHATLFDGLRPGVVIVESVWPNHAFEEGIGINALTGADPVAPSGGSAFHDNSVWIKPI